ncbi:MAG TPA: hypothetical protein VHQ42_02815 [Candidatus Limnocylindria bacterium]|nr:hypothetical protein [Candidatus Limnocylindria bacterium]
MRGILDLPDVLADLRGQARARADRLLDVRVARATIELPTEMEPWVQRTFGSLDEVRTQQVVKVTNRATLEAALIAPLRARRPIDGPAVASHLADEIASTHDDPFCHPLAGTPADTFGRVHGRGVTSGANVALADAHHAVLVFAEHDPLAFDAAFAAEVLASGRAWADRSRATDPESCNYLLVWNCLWRAGGSIVHGHAQAFLGAGPHYARLERFRRDATAYAATSGSGLVEDLVALHRDVGLAIDGADGVTVLAHVTPAKEREVLVVGTAGMDEREPAFAAALGDTLVAYRDHLGVRAFNLALWRSPLGGPDDHPPIVRIVDRGDPFQRASDIGAMELYGTPIVGSDPYTVVRDLSIG